MICRFPVAKASISTLVGKASTITHKHIFWWQYSEDALSKRPVLREIIYLFNLVGLWAIMSRLSLG